MIRRATPTDVPAIHAIECVAFGDPWSEASFHASVGADQVEALVAEDGGRVVGYAIGWCFVPEAEVANIAVAPAERRRGSGGALLDGLLSRLASRGVDTVFLEVRAGNAAARTLYETRGFEAVGRRRGYYRRPTEDAVIMRRQRKADGSAL